MSWQAAQRFVVGMCVAVFGVALNGEPVMWQVPQSRRRALEDGVEVAGLARQVAMQAVEFEAGRQVIERHGDRRRSRGGTAGHRREHRAGQGERRDPSQCGESFMPSTYWIRAPFQE